MRKYSYEISEGDGGLCVERVDRSDDGNYEIEYFYFSSWLDAREWFDEQLA